MSDTAPGSNTCACPNPAAAKNLRNLLVGSVLLCVIAGIISYKKSADTYKKETGKNLSVQEWLNGSSLSTKTVMVGMASGMVFGFIDNAGLFFGMSALDPYMSKMKYGCFENVAAGYGNTFSDGLGAFLGTFIGRIITDMTGVTDTPIWAEAVGIIVGCLLGIAVPKMLSKKEKWGGFKCDVRPGQDTDVVTEAYIKAKGSITPDVRKMLA